jgi:serine phosphatase RsbU (regulator of sigma subunit)
VDYAINGADLHFAILDGLGHGIGSTLLTGLAVGAYRHARRNGEPVAGMHAAIDAALAGYYGDDSFATGIIARLATGPGRLEWSCAGHPPPVLLRGRKVVAELGCDPTLPFGLGGGTPVPSTCELEPDDAVLLYTDGVVEARTPDGELFGLDRHIRQLIGVGTVSFLSSRRIAISCRLRARRTRHKRRSMKMTSKMITMSTTVPIPIYMVLFLPSPVLHGRDSESGCQPDNDSPGALAHGPTASPCGPGCPAS